MWNIIGQIILGLLAVLGICFIITECILKTEEKTGSDRKAVIIFPDDEMSIRRSPLRSAETVYFIVTDGLSKEQERLYSYTAEKNGYIMIKESEIEKTISAYFKNKS